MVSRHRILKRVLLALAVLSTVSVLYRMNDVKPLAPRQQDEVTVPKKYRVFYEEIVDKNNSDVDKEKHGREYVVLWYNPPHYIQVREEAKYVGFSNCKYSNCRMTFNTNNLEKSDAIIIDGRHVIKDGQFLGPRKRPLGQIWILAAHESPIEYDKPSVGKWKEVPWKNAYNWTMTYNKNVSDIYLPYGVFKKKQSYQHKDYELIASKKSNNALMITSHCGTQANRLQYARELRKYFNVTILGSCETKWECGRAHVHDDCFDILNTYKYYLAFENAMCHQYFTEKLFDNYKYDTILISRGGFKGESEATAPKGTYISTDDFKSAEELGRYLNTLSNSDYAKMLERKDMYYSPGYKEVYGQAMCDICERMNNQELYRQTIPDIGALAFGENGCQKPNDLNINPATNGNV